MAKKNLSFKELIETAKRAPKNNQISGIFCILMAVGLFIWWIVQFFA